MHNNAESDATASESECCQTKSSQLERLTNASETGGGGDGRGKVDVREN